MPKADSRSKPGGRPVVAGSDIFSQMGSVKRETEMFETLMHSAVAGGEGVDPHRFGLLVVCLLASALMGGGIALLYGMLHRGKSPSFAFLVSLPLLSVIAGMVISVVGNNMVRAFGLIGAISMVRFRTRIKRTLDMVYLFLAIGVGLACGVAQFAEAGAGLLIFGLTAVAGHVIEQWLRRRASDEPRQSRASSPHETADCRLSAPLPPVSRAARGAPQQDRP